MPRRYIPLLLSLLSPLTYGESQSALQPKGGNSRAIAEIGQAMFIGGGAIFVVVMGIALAALFGTPAMRALIGRHALIVAGGIAFPLVVLSALLVYSLSTASSLTDATAPPSARIEVVGELWWWRVRYLDERGKTVFETANEIHIPAGRDVVLSLTSTNVIHSFWVPNLAGKIDMIPGHVNVLRLHADAPGVFRGQCAEFCGAQHARMAFHVIALEPDAYEAWRETQLRPAAQPSAAELLRGRQVFMQNACIACHTIRGTPAQGTTGPDLTHVGGRRTLAAGTLTNTVGSFGGWVAASQHVKPGNLMPSFGNLQPADLRAIAAYLESLQ